MKFSLKSIVSLFATIVCIFSVVANSNYYNKQFSDKPTKLTYVNVPVNLAQNQEFSNDLKNEIVNNNYDVEYIIGENNSLTKYISGNIESINYYDKLNKVNYETKPLKDMNDVFLTKIGFYDRTQAMHTFNKLKDKYGIKEEEFISQTIAISHGVQNFELLITMVIFVLAIYIFSVSVYRNIKEIGINLVQGNSKLKTFYNVYKTDILLMVIELLMVLGVFIFFGVNLEAVKTFVILLLLLPVIFLLSFFITIKYSKISGYLKNKGNGNTLIWFSRVVFLLVILISSLLIASSPQMFAKYREVKVKRDYINQFSDVYQLNIKPYANTKGPDPIHDMINFDEDLFRYYNETPELMYILDKDMEKETVEQLDLDPRLIGTTVVMDTRYAKEFGIDLPYKEDMAVTFIDDDVYDPYYQAELESGYEKPNEFVKVDLSKYKINCFNYYDVSKSEVNPIAIRIVPMDKSEFFDKSSNGIKYKGNDIDGLVARSNEVATKYNVDDDIIYESMADLYKQESVMINNFIMYIVISAFASLLVGIITIWILVDLLIAIKIKEIMVKKLNGFKFLSIYKKDIIILNILTILGSSIIFFISKDNLFNILVLTSLLVIINLINILIIKKIENKRLLDILKQE